MFKTSVLIVPHDGLYKFTVTVLSAVTGSLDVVVVEEEIDVLLSEEEIDVLLVVETTLSLVDTLVEPSLVGALISLVLSTLLLSLTDELLFVVPHATRANALNKNNTFDNFIYTVLSKPTYILEDTSISFNERKNK